MTEHRSTSPPETMLVRRVSPVDVDGAVGLLGGAGLTADHVAACAAQRGVFVLAGLGQSPPTPPLAAAAFAPRRDGVMRLDGVTVAERLRGRGLARRLLLDVFILLRADGVHRIEAHPGVARLAGDLLRTAGFVDRDAGSGSYVHPDMVREL